MKEEFIDKFERHLEYFSERTNLVFSYHFSVIEFEDDEDLKREASQVDRAWTLKTIQNACLHTSLIALRDLDDFLTPRNRKSKPDDLRASDFGIEKSLSFLIPTERERINKLIAHSTKEGAVNVDYRWDILELISKAVCQCGAFFKWLENNHSIKDFNVWTIAVSTQARNRAILEVIQQESERLKQN
jgi:hypothetical protein